MRVGYITKPKNACFLFNQVHNMRTPSYFSGRHPGTAKGRYSQWEMMIISLLSFLLILSVEKRSLVVGLSSLRPYHQLTVAPTVPSCHIGATSLVLRVLDLVYELFDVTRVGM